MALNLRSPIFTGNTILASGYNIYKIYIYDNTAPAQPQYTIRKNYNANFNAGIIDIAELVRDYLDINFDGTYEGQCVKVKVEYEKYNSSDVLSDSGTILNDEFAFDSYSYFEENSFDVDDKSSMISNKIIFALNDNSVRIPVNTSKEPTITFLKNGNIQNTVSYPSYSTTSKQIVYTNVNNSSSYESYIDRVLGSGGVLEKNQMLK